MTLAQRRLRARVWLAWRRMLLWPLATLLEWDWNRHVVDRYADIDLIYGTTMQPHRDRFVFAVREALDLIRETDPRRFAMVRRHVRRIIGERLVGCIGTYDPHFAACLIDIAQHGIGGAGEADRWGAARVAATIIHEATHGRLEAAGFMYAEPLRAMIERLCHHEERCFAERLCRADPGYTHSVVPRFHVARWYWLWYAGFWERLRRAWRRTHRGEPSAGRKGLGERRR